MVVKSSEFMALRWEKIFVLCFRQKITIVSGLERLCEVREGKTINLIMRYYVILLRIQKKTFQK